MPYRTVTEQDKLKKLFKQYIDGTLLDKLTLGKMLRYAIDKQHFETLDIHPKQVSTWLTRYIIFKQASLKEVLSQLAHCYPVEFLLENSVKLNDTYQYLYLPNSNASETRVRPMSRQSYQNAEQHYTWSLAFTLNKHKNSLKLGYFGQRKKGDFSWVQASLYTNSINNPGILYLPLAEMVDPKKMSKDGFQYRIGSMNADKFEGKNQLDAFYAMLNNRLTEKLMH